MGRVVSDPSFKIDMFQYETGKKFYYDGTNVQAMALIERLKDEFKSAEKIEIIHLQKVVNTHHILVKVTIRFGVYICFNDKEFGVSVFKRRQAAKDLVDEIIARAEEIEIIEPVPEPQRSILEGLYHVWKNGM